MTNPNPAVQKIINWYSTHGSSVDDLIAGHADYTRASQRLGTEPLLDTLHHCRAAMDRFVAMIEHNQALPRFGVTIVDEHYQAALEHYRLAGESFGEISTGDTPESITRQIHASSALLARGTDEINATTAVIAMLAVK